MSLAAREDPIIAPQADPPAAGLMATKENVASVLDAVRQARRMAADAGASFHGFYVKSRNTIEHGLTLCFDREFPRSSELSRTICGTEGAAWTAQSDRALTPVWWPADTGAPHCPALSVLAVARRGTPLVPALPGVALPVFADGGASGFAAFAGRELTLDDAMLCDLHIRAFAVFRAVAGLRLAQEGAAPSISWRELQCLKLTADGRTSEEIAAALGLSVHTANQYVATTMHKLNAVNRMHAVAKALRLGLID